ncbi:MAG TPA: thiol:disulfide interchange protein DsbA/DsbL [Rubrivivax sp.]|nr:thiol:disulfide interchange protein DsbA/DsbL [Burkholderiales bacterium]HNT37972.1 thiol:disulfide interchange protein DsbA/DsbL [Rubrivivax sp.]
MKRRDFSIQLAGLGLAAATGKAAHAQAPAEGRQYVKLAQPLPASMLPPPGKIDVSEFFWYECPHCNVFEPLLEAWSKRLPAEVAFRRVPVGFTARHQVGQKLYYALEEIGALEMAHRKIFAAIHTQGQRLISENDAVALATAAGADKTKFVDAYRSFQVNTKAAKARQLADAYKVDGVPLLGLGGRYFTSASLAGSHERALQVADYLIQLARKG